MLKHVAGRLSNGVITQGKPKVACGFIQRSTLHGQIQAIPRLGQGRQADILCEVEYLGCSESLSKKYAGGFWQLMRFIKDDGITVR
jgi:hypothetical protein